MTLTQTQPKQSTFGTFGRFTELPLDEMSREQRDGYDYVVRERGQAPGPYKIFIANPKLMQVVVPIGVYFENGHSSLSKPEIEIATNLINAKWLAAYANYEHEMIAVNAGLPADKVSALIAGLPTSFDDSRQQVIYEMTHALIGPHIVPEALYERTVQLIGDVGLTDLTFLIGYFTTVGLTLTAYNVPADAVGLKR